MANDCRCCKPLEEESKSWQPAQQASFTTSTLYREMDRYFEKLLKEKFTTEERRRWIDAIREHGDAARCSLIRVLAYRTEGEATIRALYHVPGEEIVERDERIYSQVKQGKSYAVIAEEFGISRGRVGQIVKRQREKQAALGIGA